MSDFIIFEPALKMTYGRFDFNNPGDIGIHHDEFILIVGYDREFVLKFCPENKKLFMMIPRKEVSVCRLGDFYPDFISKVRNVKNSEELRSLFDKFYRKDFEKCYELRAPFKRDIILRIENFDFDIFFKKYEKDIYDFSNLYLSSLLNIEQIFRNLFYDTALNGRNLRNVIEQISSENYLR